MRTLPDLAGAGGPGLRAPTLLVLLPPAAARLEEFQEQGFHAAVRRRGIEADILVADAGMEAHADGGIAEAIERLALEPARARGARAIWLAGISLGAYNALHYLSRHAGRVSGACLLAPYPGTGDVLAEIEAHGGPAAWSRARPAGGETAGDDRAWWRWLCRECQAGAWPTSVHLATGGSDRFVRGQRMIAGLLPGDRVRILPGSHDWSTWRALWDDWLDRGPLAVRRGPAPTPE
jgi:pimeloyl-ACP methyl ester carboxylesterase